MAYIPPQYDPNRPNQNPFALASGSGSAVGAPASGSAPSAPPPSSDGRFGAMRAFFAANQPAANAQIGEVTAPIEEQAKNAQALTGKANGLYENEGGADVAGQAMTARDEALGRVKDTASVEGIGGLLGEGRDATYTEGQRNADAYLFGRAPGLGGWRDKWAGILGALDPKYRTGNRPAPAPTSPPPSSRPPAIPGSGNHPNDPGGSGGFTKPTPKPRPTDPNYAEKMDEWEPRETGYRGPAKEIY